METYAQATNGRQAVGCRRSLSLAGFSVDQTLIGNVARITVAAVRNVIATPIKIH